MGSLHFLESCGLKVRKIIIILWQADPLIGNDCEESSYTTAVAR
jgi:hypothetical protein